MNVNERVPPSLALAGVSYRWPGAPSPALAGVDLEVAPGELVGLIGPNGAGKTTLLRLAAGLLRPDAGTVRLAGVEPARAGRRATARLAAFVPSSLHAGFPLSVREFVALGRIPHLAGFFEGPRDRAAVREALAFMDAAAFRDRSCDALSTGEQKRVLIARAIAQEPRLLLLDEPTGDLDIAHGVFVLDRIAARARDTGLAVVAAIHDLNLALLYCHRVVLLSGGRPVAVGEPEQVMRYPRVREVFGCDVYVGRNELNGKLYVVPLGGGTATVDR